MPLRPRILAALLVLAPWLVTPAAQAQNVALVSSLGAKCMDAEGGTRKGARLIGYACTGSSNQQFALQRDGTIRQGSLCVDASGGLGRQGDGIILWDCNGGANQRWSLGTDGSLRGISGRCMDLQGGDNPVYWVMNQPVILWDCHGGRNQVWYRGLLVPRSAVSAGQASGAITAGRLGVLQATQLTDRQRRLIGVDGGTLIGVDGGTLIAAGGQNLIAAGGQNLIVVVR